MAFRTGMKWVFTGAGGPCLIKKDRLTLPQMLRNKGYTTACFGKWHIGMTFFDKQGRLITGGNEKSSSVPYKVGIRVRKMLPSHSAPKQELTR